MAEVFVSPGVYTQEMDDTFSPPPGAAAIGAALVGFTKKECLQNNSKLNNQILYSSLKILI